MGIVDLESVVDDADPDTLEAIALEVAPLMRVVWVATLRDTCHRCLPLHGTEMLLSEFDELGLSPATIHGGWTSECNCRRIPTNDSQGRAENMQPLRRIRVKGTPRGTKKTMRAVSQVDLQKSIEASLAAQESKEGRKILRLLGRVGAEEE